MKPKALIAAPAFPEVENYIAQHCDYYKWEGEHPISREKLLQIADENRDAEGLMVKYTPVDAEIFDLLPDLKIVSNVTVGYDNLDVQEMKKRGIIGTNTPGVLDETVVDTAFALVLAAARRIVELDKYVKSGQWVEGPDSRFYGFDVHHAKLGIIGMGRIGEVAARRGKLGFNMEVSYFNRKRKPEIEEELGVKFKPMDDLLASSDFVILLTPLNSETKHLIGEREFSLMKETSVFINVSRGQTVDEKSLIKALEEGKIYAAGLDVFEKEPVDSDNPLLNMDNVVAVPHIGSATAKTYKNMAMLAAKNLTSVCLGKNPLTVLPELDFSNSSK